MLLPLVSPKLPAEHGIDAGISMPDIDPRYLGALGRTAFQPCLWRAVDLVNSYGGCSG